MSDRKIPPNDRGQNVRLLDGLLERIKAMPKPPPPPDPHREKVGRYLMGRPSYHERDFHQGWEQFRSAPPEVHAEEQKKYNALAKSSQANRGKAMLADDDLGRTFVQFPQSPPLNKLSDQRVIGPYPPPAMPQVRAISKLGRPDVERHEQLHVDSVMPDEAGYIGTKRPPMPAPTSIPPAFYDQERAYYDGVRRAEFEKLSPRERELYRIYKTMRNEADPHAPHAAYDPKSIDQLLAELKAAKK